MGGPYVVEEFSESERARLARYVTNLDRPVFALTNLPEVTCAALFARYSRTPKSLRRLLLDEFLEGEEVALLGRGAESGNAGAAKASSLFSRVLADYGDDSVAQLAGLHIACEQASQPLLKAIEWGRLAAYLEQSTRYIPYTDKRDGWYRYYRDPELMASPHGDAYVGAMDHLFDTYVAVIASLQAHLDRTLPSEADEKARHRAIRALALDIARGLLPAGTISNVGVFASAQSWEQMVMRLRAHQLPEAQQYAELINDELQACLPDFVTRLDREDRGGVWVDYLRDTAAAARDLAGTIDGTAPVLGPAGVRLLEWEEDAEDRVLAAALFPWSDLRYDAVLGRVEWMSAGEKQDAFKRIVGERRNRRHRPDRAFEHATYTFEIVSDYGAFRDLQRHRMLTMQWQSLTPGLGQSIPDEVVAAGCGQMWQEAVDRANDVYERMRADFPEQAQYLVTLGHRVRYLMRLNAREAMHLIELRSSPQGHPAYRWVCREMHRLIDTEAGHHLIASAMRFVGSEDVHLPRYAAEAARAEQALENPARIG